MGPLKAAIAEYRRLKKEEHDRNRLINKDLDYNMLRKMLASLADNPEKLMIVIKQANGTIIELKREQKKQSQIRDLYMEEIS